MHYTISIVYRKNSDMYTVFNIADWEKSIVYTIKANRLDRVTSKFFTDLQQTYQIACL